MAYQNFIPTVWNEGIERELERICVFAEDCNRKYEGSVKEKGESVKILGVGKPTIKSLAKANKNNDIDAPEEIEDTSVIATTMFKVLVAVGITMILILLSVLRVETKTPSTTSFAEMR